MAKVLVKANVANPGEFHRTFEKQDRPTGAGRFASGVDDNVRNIGYVIIEWDSISSAKHFWASARGKSQIAEWRSVTEPEIVYVRERPED